MRRIQTPNLESQTSTKPEKRQKRQAHSKSFAISGHRRSCSQPHGAPPFRGGVEPRASVMECGCPFCRVDSQTPTNADLGFGVCDVFEIWDLEFVMLLQVL